MKSFTLTWIAITIIVCIGCTSTIKNPSISKDDSIKLHRESDSLTRRLTQLDNLVNNNVSDSLQFYLTEILKVNQRLEKILPITEYIKIENNRNNSGTKRISDGGITIKGFYRIGMTDKEARRNLGDPDDINRTVTPNGTREQWVYNSKNLYLYFEDGILVTYQESGK